MKKKNHLILIGVIFIIVGIGVMAFSIGYGFSFSSLKDIIKKDHYIGDYELESFQTDFDEEYKEVQINADVSDVTIHKSNKLRLEVTDAVKGTVHTETDDQTLKIYQDEVKSHGINISFFGITGSFPNTKIDLYIPSDIPLDSIKCVSSVGDINIDYLDCKYTELTSDVGSIDITFIKTDKALIKSNIGDTYIESGFISAMTMTSDVGDIDVSAELSGINNFESEVGNIEITVIGDKDTFYVDADSDVGSSHIDGKKTSGYGYESAENHIIADSDVGSIDIDFERRTTYEKTVQD